MKRATIFLTILLSCGDLLSQEANGILKIADSLLAAGNYSTALLHYQDVNRIDQTEAAAIVGMAYCQYNLGEYRKCIQTSERALKHKLELPSKYGQYDLQAAAYFELQDWEKAIKFYTKYLDVFYDQYQTYPRRGFAYYSLDKYYEALEDYRYSLKDPHISEDDRVSTFSLMGFCYADIGDSKSALKYAELAGFIDPNYTNVTLLKAQLLYDSAEYASAMPLYEKLYEEDTTNMFALFRFAYCKYSNDQFEEALVKFRKQSLIEPDSDECLNMIAWILFLTKKFDEALWYADQAIKLNKEDGNLYDTRGCIYYGQKEYSKAVKDFNTSISVDKNQVNSYYYRGLTYLALNDVSKARKDFEKILSFKDYVTPVGEATVEDLLLKINKD